jgi:hypothetical protein
MRVYHFLPASYALEDIEKQHLKISEIDQLNDPFELWCVNQKDRRLRQSLRAYKQEVGRRFGMICFSKRWHNPLLWSHYADKHRGICLGFEIDERGLKPIQYVTERPTLKIPPTTEDADQLLFTKFKDWQYEEEWRNWFLLEEREGPHYFYPFDGFVQLREVIVGPLCEVQKPRIRQALTRHSGPIAIIKARLAFKTFQVVRNRQAFRR